MHNSNSNTHVLEVSEFYVAFLLCDASGSHKFKMAVNTVNTYKLYLGPNTT